jgi:hypothetical protein
MDSDSIRITKLVLSKATCKHVSENELTLCNPILDQP